MAGKQVLKALCLQLLLFSVTAQAGELRDLYRGARMQAMGGAYTAVADDEQTVFLNPAGLAGVKKAEIHYLTADIDLSADIYSAYSESSDAFSDLSIESVESLMGKNIYGRVQLSPTLTLPNMGIGFIVDGQAAFYGKNLSLPQITFGYQNTNGIQAGAGFSLAGKHRRRGRYPDFRVGFAGKLLWRRGGYRKVPLTTLFNLSQGKSLVTDLAGSYGMGIGVDLGTHYVHPFSDRLTLSLGSAFLDIGDTHFASEADPIRGNWSLGAALRYEMPAFHVLLAYDYRNILEDTDWRQKNHLGVELGFPMFRIYGGINQVYLTYGVAFDIWVFRLTAYSYGQELGTFVRQDPDRRYSLRLDFKFDI